MSKFVYLLKLSESGYYKIGYSKDVRNRINILKTGNAEEITLINKYETDYYKEIETFFHNRYSYKKLNGECFDLSLEDEFKCLENCQLCEKNLIILQKNKI